MFTIHNVQQCKHPSFPTMRGQQNSTHFLLAAFVASLKVVWVCDAFAFNHRAGFVPPSPAGNVYSTAVSNVVGPVAFGDRPPVQALHDWRRKGLRRLDASLAKIPRYLFYACVCVLSILPLLLDSCSCYRVVAVPFSYCPRSETKIVLVKFARRKWYLHQVG